MHTVAVVGAGDLGGAVAQALARGDRVSRIVLIDHASTVAAGKALDIQQSGAVDGFHTRLSGTDDVTAATGAAVCVVADRFGGAEWQGDDGLGLLRRLVPYLSGAPLVFAGARQSDLMLHAAREGGVSRTRIIGSAPEAFASAVRAIVAVEAGCSPSEIVLAALGAPAAGFVVPWSEASIGGYALERVLSPVQLTRIQARTARLWPQGPHTLGLAAARAAEAIVTASRRRLNALIVLDNEFGVRNRIGALPVLMNSRGIAQVLVPSVNTRERVAVETSLGGA